MQQDCNGAVIASPADDRESLLPALFRGVDLSDGVLHATLDTERARHDAVVNIGRPVEQRRGPLKAFLAQLLSPVVLECDDQLQPELALAGLPGDRERSRMLSRSGMTRS